MEQGCDIAAGATQATLANSDRTNGPKRHPHRSSGMLIPNTYLIFSEVNTPTFRRSATWLRKTGIPLSDVAYTRAAAIRLRGLSGAGAGAQPQLRRAGELGRHQL